MGNNLPIAFLNGELVVQADCSKGKTIFDEDEAWPDIRMRLNEDLLRA